MSQTHSASTSEVKFLDLTRHYKEIKSEVLPLFEEILETQSLIMGNHIQSFEKEVAAWIGVKHARCVSSGTDALILGLRAMGVGEGDEVITPAYSFIASTTSILLIGATPVFVDIDPVTFNMDPTKIESKITSKTKAIMPVHLYGQMADMKPIMAIAKKHGLKVIEDYAQSIGATSPDGASGAIGDVGATSFYPTKNLGAAGDAGMITTNNDEYAEQISLLRAHGEKAGIRYTHLALGTNSRLDAFQGAYLRVKLKRLNGYMKSREDNAKFYLDRLSKYDGKAITLPITKPGYKHVWNQFVIRVQNRDQVQAALAKLGVQTMIYYPKTVADHVITKAFDKGPYPQSEKACKEVLALPIYPELTKNEIEAVVKGLETVLG